MLEPKRSGSEEKTNFQYIPNANNKINVITNCLYIYLCVYMSMYICVCAYNSIYTSLIEAGVIHLILAYD